MNEVQKVNVRAISDQCAAMNAADARQAFARGNAMTAEGLAWMAYAIRRLEELKQDDALQQARQIVGAKLFELLRKVAYGNTMPEVLIRFKGDHHLQTLVGSLPEPDQRKLVNGEPVEVAVIHQGRIDKVMKDPLSLEPQQLRQVFAGGRIHTFAEQRSHLEVKLIEEQTKPPEKVGRAKLDHDRAVAELPRGEYTLAELIDIVAALRRSR